jgi:hypothetical protein
LVGAFSLLMASGHSDEGADLLAARSETILGQSMAPGEYAIRAGMVLLVPVLSHSD